MHEFIKHIYGFSAMRSLSVSLKIYWVKNEKDGFKQILYLLACYLGIHNQKFNVCSIRQIYIQ